MEKSKKKKKLPVVEEPAVQHNNTWGYRDPMEVAEDISGGIHSSLLQGYYVFAMRTTESDIQRLVVTRIAEDTWMYGMITTGWTCLVPRITREGLLATILPDLESKRINKNIIEDFKYFISQ